MRGTGAGNLMVRRVPDGCKRDCHEVDKTDAAERTKREGFTRLGQRVALRSHLMHHADTPKRVRVITD